MTQSTVQSFVIVIDSPCLNACTCIVQRFEFVADQLYLAVNDIERTRTKTYSPQTNGICERFHRTVKEEFYEIAFRKKVYSALDDLQADLDAWVKVYNNDRSHQGKMCCGRTPMQTLRDGRDLWEEKVSSLN